MHLQNSKKNGSLSKLSEVRSDCLFLKGRNGDRSPLPSYIYREGENVATVFPLL